MSVVFKTFDVIEIDGIAAGNIVDVISNHAPRRAEVLAAFGVYVAALQTEINAEKTQLQADKTQLTTDLATANASIATLTSEKTSLTSQLDTKSESIADLQGEVEGLESERNQLNRDITALQAKVADLSQYRPFNPRWTTPDYFINRFTAKEAKAFYSSEDAMIVGGQQLLEAYEAAGWYVDLDDTQVQGLTGYMLQLGMLTPERREQVLRDATAAEAWYPQ
jgi:vacuolar-type H+-ATPase subunit I/STV1